jgi:hypothetical protein
LFVSSASAEEPAFTASFSDGFYVTDAKLVDWQNSGSQPRLNDRPLFAGQGVRWVQNQSLQTPILPDSFVEMVGGDRFPGRVLEYSDGTASYDERLAAHLIVKPEIGVDYPDQIARSVVRVLASALRRVVWQRRGSDRYQPGTLFYVDGRQTPFRTLRWSSDAVLVLLEDGSRRVPFSEIAEVHLPRRDAWDAYYDALAVLTPDCTARLMRVETVSGLVALVSLDRFQARAVSGDSSGWYHMLQPAWSLDPLWVKHSTIAWRRFFQPQQVALSMIEPESAVQHSTFSGGRPWQVDRSVAGTPLHSAGKTFGWGWGVHAYIELAFPVPATASSFRTLVGLDNAAGRGGCAVARAYFNRADPQQPSQTPLFQTPTMIGAAEVHDSGPLSVPYEGNTKLILVADSSPANPPAGADPFDIRDMVNWLEPAFDLDLEKLKAEVGKRLPDSLPAWQGWTVDLASGARLQVTHRWDASDGRNQQYRTDALAQGAALRLRRRIKPGPLQNYLLLSLARNPDGTQPSRAEIQIDGNTVGEIDVPERRGESRPEVQAVSLKPYQGREVELTIIHKPSGDKSAVQWRSLELVEGLTATPWIALSPGQITSNATELSFRPLEDQSVLASGKAPEQCAYTIVAQTPWQRITALRLEALCDPSLPNKGPGLAGNGNFVLSDLRVTAAPIGDPRKAQQVEFQDAGADFSQQEYPVVAAVDDNPQSGWGTMSQPARPHLAVFTLKQDIGFAEGTVLTITLDHRAASQHALGRFRLAVTDAPRPVPVERPASVLSSTANKTAIQRVNNRRIGAVLVGSSFVSTAPERVAATP